MRLDEGPPAVRIGEPRRAREGARVDAQRHGQRRDRSERRRRARRSAIAIDRRLGYSRQPVSTHADERRVVGQGRPVLPAARRRRGARAAAARRGGALERAGRRADGEGQHHHARAERPHDDVRPDRATCRRDAASASGDDHHQAAGPVDADGHRAEEPRRAAEGDRADGLRDRRPRAGHEVGGREGVPGLRRRRQALRLRRDPRTCRACAPRCSSRFPIPR